MKSKRANEIPDFSEILDDAERLATTGWDINFVSDMQDRYFAYEGDMYISDLQLKQLLRIAGRN
jgi:hypothetical protein